MKIVGMVGSPRGAGGSTGRLLKLVLEGAEGLGAETEIIALKGWTVQPCLACDTCHKKGYCPQEDRFEAIKSQILASDGLVLASPNYIYSVSAQLKAFLDRCCGVIHCMGFEGKYGASVVTSGGGDESPIAEYLNHFLMTTGITPVGSVWATMGLITGPGFPPELEEQARALGRNLVQAWQEKRTWPEVDRVKSDFAERMRNLMLWRREEWPFEYDYWRRNRGLDPKTS